MVRISQIGLSALLVILVLLVAAPMGSAYVSTYGDMTTYGAGGACPPAGCPPPWMANPLAGYGAPQQMPPCGYKPIRKVKRPITKVKPNFCPPPMCMPQACPPPMCAPGPCGPIGCGPMSCTPPVKWY